MDQTEPVYELHVPRSAAMLCLTALGKVPIELGLEAFLLLRDQIAGAEARARDTARGGTVGGPDGPAGVRD